MDCLADTVTVIRHFSEAGKIGRKAYELISGVERGQHHCYVSTISLVEILCSTVRVPAKPRDNLGDMEALNSKASRLRPRSIMRSISSPDEVL